MKSPSPNLRTDPRPPGAHLGPLAAPLDLDVLLPRRGRRCPQPKTRWARLLVATLAENIRATGLYPPLIVRPHPRVRRRWQVLDGLARAQALRRLGASQARCEIWLVDDTGADVLAATLNHLRGPGDAKDHARLLARLVRRFGPRRAARLLGLSESALRNRLAALDAPAPARPEEVLPLHAVTFHLTPPEARRLEAMLDRCPGRRGASRPRRRGRALLALMEGKSR